MSAAATEPLAGLLAGKAGYVTETHDGVVSIRGVLYGERLDPLDRFSALGDPSPERPQAAATVFPQSPGSLDWLIGPAVSRMPQSEDSFLLDIWAPEGAKDLPVLVFLPGGAFISGAGNVRWYDGARLAREGGAVVVTVNYRLGALGLLDGGADLGPRNLAAGDILQALTWIHRNIAAFGGDPGATTLAGHSAGAWYAYVLSFAARARGLFNRTALFSLPWQPPLNTAEFADRSKLFAAALGAAGGAGGGAVGGSPESAATAGEILAAQDAVSKAYAGRGLGLMPAADGDLVPSWAMDFEAAAAEMHVDALLLSSTDDEAAAFLHALPVQAVGPEQLAGFVGAHFAAAEAKSFIEARHPGATDHTKLVEAMSLHQFRLAATELAGRAGLAGIPATLLRFSVRSRLDGAGSPHCFDLPFLFGNRADWQDAPMLEGFPCDVFDSVSNRLRPLLLGFVADGVARTHDGRPVPSFDPKRPALYSVGETGSRTAGVEPELRPRR